MSKFTISGSDDGMAVLYKVRKALAAFNLVFENVPSSEEGLTYKITSKVEPRIFSGLSNGIPEAQEITDWKEVADGTFVFEDTYNEVYVVFSKGPEKWIRQVGWQIDRGKPIPDDSERPLDFEPQALYDQPWFRLKG